MRLSPRLALPRARLRAMPRSCRGANMVNFELLQAKGEHSRSIGVEIGQIYRH